MPSGSRSVSLSSGKDLKYHQPQSSTASLRSTSIGSSFFTPNNNAPAHAHAHVPTSNSSSSNEPSFLNGENTSANCTNSTESEDNELIEPSKDIDIVGAISTLHLDDDDDDDATATDTNNISGVKTGNKHNPQYGSITPQSLAKTRSGNSKNTWNITQLAPPQPIRSSVSENGSHPNDQSVFVKPFELPESQEDASKKQTTNGLNLPLLGKILDSEGVKGNDQNTPSNNTQFYDGAIPFVPINHNVSGNGNSQIPPPPLGNIPLPMSSMPPPLPPHSMGVPSFSPFPHPSFYQGYVPSPPAHTPTPGDYQSFEKIPSVSSPAPPVIQESQASASASQPQPQQQQQLPAMWNPLHSPLVRLPFGQQQLQTVYSPTQPTQLPLTPQQGQPQQQQPPFPVMPQHNYHQHNQYHPRPHYRNNNGMMNVHRKNLRRKEDGAKYSDAKLQDFTGSILTLCKDQHGCRFLQRELFNETNATLIFNEIYFKVVELMIDPFGNYLIQKLFTMINLEQRLVLINQSSNELFRIALDPHGTRSLQKLIDVIENNEEIEIITRNLYSNIVVLSRDLNGNHVVQKILTKFNTISHNANSSHSSKDETNHENQNQNQFIFDIIQANLLYIACHRHGCCVLQRCLDYGNKQQCQQLSQEIAKHTIKLSLDPYGNYVVQYVLNKYSVSQTKIIDDEEDKQVMDNIMQEIKSNFIQLSLHKFGSNVIEKCLKITLISNDLIDNLIELDHGQAFNQLLNDPFGNYVLQTSLDVANLEQFEQLSKILLPLLPNIKSTPHGRRILNKIQQ